RSSAMAFNRIADRDIDALNPRTRNRHLPAGAISLKSAWTLLIVATMVFAGACYLINPLCFLLCPVAMAIVWFYSLTKRFTDFTHIYLGIALSLAPIGAWIAVKGSLDTAPVILAAGVVCWLVGFDIIYSIQDYEFDRKNRLHSLPVRWGIQASLIFAFFCHMIMWIFLFAFGLLSGFKVAYSSAWRSSY
ncbi:MAG: 4-hydroxybenzoate octaprenyltransferase, partial [Nitrospinaceae bacterium]|nr:4-hydroxybenzoate octaprenyltransferase [Nitrospinaceae bacterium]